VKFDGRDGSTSVLARIQGSGDRRWWMLRRVVGC
jgi:hypothetical protein